MDKINASVFIVTVQKNFLAINAVEFTAKER
jgi:hypothetical protein